MSRAVLIAGGEIFDYEFIRGFITEDDYIACADRGIVHCNNMKLSANLWVGDFDSCDYETYRNSDAASNAETVQLKPEKDQTDTEFALEYLIDTIGGFDSILLLGAIGSRMDHTLANIYLLESMAEEGIYMEILNENNRIRLVRDSGVYLEKSVFKYVSIIPVSEIIQGVDCSNGLKYKLSGAIMSRKSTLGVSNEIVGDNAAISVFSGCALIIESRD